MLEITNKIETEIIGDINWNLFSSNYVKLVEGEPIDLVLKNFRQTEEDYNGDKSPGVRADVIKENGYEVKKILVMTSKRLINEIEPFVKKAQKLGDPEVKVRILRSGKGFNTQYSVRSV